jgi:flagellum-specific ATP synthase
VPPMYLTRELLNEISCGGSITSISGKVSGIVGQTILAKLPHACLGDICSVIIDEKKKIMAQVVSFNEENIFLAPFSDIRGISPGTKVIKEMGNFNVSTPALEGGIVIDALGNVLYRQSTSNSNTKIDLDLFRPAPDPLSRKAVNKQLVTGIKSIDSLCAIGYGQRLGLFASAGLGKSTLLGMLARSADTDINVIALTGERGREVGEFIEQVLGKEGLSKSIIVVATSDKPALQRSLAAITATAIAEHHRSLGKNVLLLVDSLTRMARAIRDVSLAAGELPIRQGLTSSVYSELPKLIERAGNDDRGSITAIYTLLDNSEYESDPLAEEVKSLLDGHICLDSQVAASGIRPAIDFTRSISRCLNNLLNEEGLEARNLIIKILSKIKKEKDLILMGGTADQELQACLETEKDLSSFLNQSLGSRFTLRESYALVSGILSAYKLKFNYQ